MPIPEFLSRADWEPVVEAASTVAEKSGFSFGIKDVEGLLTMAERFESTFMRIGNKIMEMRRFDQNDAGAPAVADPVASPIEPGKAPVASNSHHEPAGAGQADFAPTGAGAGQITADKVYHALMGALNEASKTFPDMKTGEMLTMAREMRSVILPEIQKSLVKMATPDR